LTVGEGCDERLPRRKSGMSAACALDTVPIITAASRNLRIANAPSDTSELEADHRSLTLTNRSRAASIGNLRETNPKIIFALAAANENGAGRSRAVNNS
jgi:hypothetical protein